MIRTIRIAGLFFIASCFLSACNGTVSTSVEGQDGSVSVPVVDDGGTIHYLSARLCRPAGADGTVPLVIIAHGSPADGAARPNMKLGSCSGEAEQWFLRRGYAVMLALRRGYGATGGAWAESFGSCAKADFVKAGRESARDLDAQVTFGTKLPGIRPYGVTVVGLSAGGWGTIAYDSLPHPLVDRFVVMAGGRGGHQHGIPNNNCAPDRLAAAAGDFGKTARTPMLWIYAENDTFFAPPIADALYSAFTANGGKASFVRAPSFRSEGHTLFTGHEGSAIWGPHVSQYLAKP